MTGGVTLYVDLYQDHPSMIFHLFLTAGHLSHSILVADQDFLTAEAKNVSYLTVRLTSIYNPQIGGNFTETSGGLTNLFYGCVDYFME